MLFSHCNAHQKKGQKKDADKRKWKQEIESIKLLYFRGSLSFVGSRNIC